ncbi:MAG: phosphate acetyltransferase [Thermodesulfobacteriota bacterium]
MAQNLYIATLEPASGKLAITLGVMEMLSRQTDRLGFFRPIVSTTASDDNDLAVVADRYELGFSLSEMVGMSHDEARGLLSAGQYREMLAEIVGRFQAVQERCDFVLCEGLDITTLSETFSYDINVDIARTLGTPALYVANGHEQPAAEILETVQVASQAFSKLKCPLLGVIVNRVAPGRRGALATLLKEKLPQEYFSGILPEEEELSLPTVAEIMAAVKGSFYTGSLAGLDRVVHDLKVAAMAPANFLNHVAPGDLIITPGDRADIILATLGAVSSSNFPAVAGILLSGDLLPDDSIKRLLDGLGDLTIPVISCGGDTYRAARQAGAVAGRITPGNPRKIATALGLFESSLNWQELSDRIAVSRADTISPTMFQYNLFSRAREERQHIVLPEGGDERILRAAEILLLREVAELTILGDGGEIRQRALAMGLDLSGAAIINPLSSELLPEFAATFHRLRRHKGVSLAMAGDMMTDPSYFGTMMVYLGRAHGMVSGAAHTTANTIRPAFEVIKTKAGVSLVSSVFFMGMGTRVLVFGDCAINPNPDAAQLADIAISSAATAAMFGVEPRVAMLSYSSGTSGQGADVELVRAATELARAKAKNLIIDGPLQFDAAYDASVAGLKMPDSEVAGQATVFIFPDLNTGNNTYKAVQRSAGVVAMGPILQGLKRPVNDLSRGCQVADIVNTVAITVIQAQGVVVSGEGKKNG